MRLKQQEQQTSSLKKKKKKQPLPTHPEDLIPALQRVILKAAFETLHSVVKSVAGHSSNFRASLEEGAEL